CVLAGGRGTRMRGQDKLLLSFSGERLLSRMARHLSARFTDLVAVSSRPEVFSGLGYRVVPDSYADAGPIAGLHAALVAARSEWVYLLACDMPFFSAAWVDSLESAIASSGSGPVAAAARAGRHFEPFHAMYHRSLANSIENAFAAGGKAPSIQSVVRMQPALLIEAPDAAEQLFLNINTPEELAEAEALAVARSQEPGARTI
ncbi:MAG: molybdenum cofactor guanylyltransferase, partial [Spirochaetales bacterium]|nr:molybdenum cofactor guanylyltransferase [Spirochaetales bacterium]